MMEEALSEELNERLSLPFWADFSRSPAMTAPSPPNERSGCEGPTLRLPNAEEGSRAASDDSKRAASLACLRGSERLATDAWRPSSSHPSKGWLIHRPLASSHGPFPHPSHAATTSTTASCQQSAQLRGIPRAELEALSDMGPSKSSIERLSADRSP